MKIHEAHIELRFEIFELLRSLLNTELRNMLLFPASFRLPQNIWFGK
jgi:hypothetical protein